MEPKTIGAARFKEQCLALLDRLAPEGLVITKRGNPVARVLPYHQDFASLIVHGIPLVTRDRATRRSSVVPLAG